MQILSAIISVLIGIAVSLALFWLLHVIVERLPRRARGALLPYSFIGPVLLLIVLFLIYPAVRTVVLSLYDRDGEQFVGLENYLSLFGDADFLRILANNLLWIIVVPITALLLGLVAAVMSDRVGGRRENLFKSAVFFPMAISFIAAATIWKFVYDYRPPGQPQVGLLNALWVALTSGEPVPWLTVSTASLNSLLMMVIIVWLQTGFAMVLLSAAIKGVPEETIEAARVDGANERQVFFRIVLPQIRTTMLAVFVTILVLVMKIFDIVYAMTGGNYKTSVLGLEFVRQLFEFGNPGIASAVIVLLMIAVIPVMVYQVRSFRKQEEVRA